MASLNVNVSSLTIKEASDMIYSVYQNHAQADLTVVNGFAKYAEAIANRSVNSLHSSWVPHMTAAVSAIKLLVGLADSSNESYMFNRALSTVIALGYMVDKTPNLNFFRTKSLDIVRFEENPFVLTDMEKARVSLFMSNVFMFWLAYDQIDANLNSRAEIRSILEQATHELAGSESISLEWMKLVIIHKFNDLVSTSVSPTSIRLMERNLIEFPDEARYTVVLINQVGSREINTVSVASP